MRLVGIKYLYGRNFKLGINLYGVDGKLLLARGATLTPRAIDHLKKIGIWEVYIEDPDTTDIVVEGVLDETTRRKILMAINKEFSKTRIVEDRKFLDIDLEVFRGIVKIILKHIFLNKQKLINLLNLKTFDDYIYVHSLDVTIYSLILGVELAIHDDKLELLGLGAILHDVGKLFLPSHIINKEEKLTEEEYNILKSHVLIGYDILGKIIGMPTLSKTITLFHHERYDGTGYPRGLKNGEIPLFPRIVAIADVYDALTSDRPWREAFLPHMALEYLLSGGDTLFEKRLVRTFMEKIAVYPLATTVKLTTGEIGVVRDVKPGFSSRPTVRILYDSSGRRLKSDEIYEINLLEKPSILIEKVVKAVDPKDEKGENENINKVAS